MLLAAALIWAIYKYLPRRTFVLLAIAGVGFMAGAMGVDIVTSSMHFSAFTSQGFLAALEEGMEFAFCILALYAIIDYIERQHKELFVSLSKQISQARK